jgi:hypothetical protein
MINIKSKKRITMIRDFNFSELLKDYQDENCDEEKNTFLCDSQLDKKKILSSEILCNY